MLIGDVSFLLIVLVWIVMSSIFQENQLFLIETIFFIQSVIHSINTKPLVSHSRARSMVCRCTGTTKIIEVIREKIVFIKFVLQTRRFFIFPNDQLTELSSEGILASIFFSNGFFWNYIWVNSINLWISDFSLFHHFVCVFFFLVIYIYM